MQLMVLCWFLNPGFGYVSAMDLINVWILIPFWELFQAGAGDLNTLNDYG